jgi:hypothetical protein
VAYELESVLEPAIAAEFKASAGLIKVLWERLIVGHPYLEENIDTRLAQFELWTAAEGRRGLPGLLRSLDPTYPGLYQMWIKQGETDPVSPEIYDFMERSRMNLWGTTAIPHPYLQ